jgi:Tetratricopeptide repeat
MNQSPSFSQPRAQTNPSGSGGRNPYAENSGAAGRNAGSRNPSAGAGAANRSQNPYSNSGAGAAGAGVANRDQGRSNAGVAAAGAGVANRDQGRSNAGVAAAGAGVANRDQGRSNAGVAAAGAGVANRNQGPSNAGAAAAGATAANRNQSQNARPVGAAGAGAAYANRNQSAFPNAGAAGAGAAYANRNQGAYPNAGAAAAGAAYANRNQNSFPNGGAAAAGAIGGAAYANRNQYNQFHPGMAAGYWNDNYGASAVGGVAAVAAWGVGSAAYGYGYSSYTNPYFGGGAGDGGGQPAVAAQPASASSYDYSQPVNTAAEPPAPTAADQGGAAVSQARDAFQSGDYATALQLTQQALAQMPNDTTLHEFLGLVYFAQGKYEDAAAPLFAVLSVGPGWDWTTLISNYSDADIYDKQLRGLEAFVRANPKSAKAQFVLAYQYICQGQGQAAINPLENVVALQPNDTVSAQLLAKLRPSTGATAAPPSPAPPQPFDMAKLTGSWVAQPQNAKITLSIKADGGFNWAVNAPGKPPVTISGNAEVADGVLTLTSDQPNSGNMAGTVDWQDDTHFAFRAVGAPASDPGLKFAR